jgi:hypothetical protein
MYPGRRVFHRVAPGCRRLRILRKCPIHKGFDATRRNEERRRETCLPLLRIRRFVVQLHMGAPIINLLNQNYLTHSSSVVPSFKLFCLSPFCPLFEVLRRLIRRESKSPLPVERRARAIAHARDGYRGAAGHPREISHCPRACRPARAPPTSQSAECSGCCCAWRRGIPKWFWKRRWREWRGIGFHFREQSER